MEQNKSCFCSILQMLNFFNFLLDITFQITVISSSVTFIHLPSPQWTLFFGWSFTKNFNWKFHSSSLYEVRCPVLFSWFLYFSLPDADLIICCMMKLYMMKLINSSPLQLTVFTLSQTPPQSYFSLAIFCLRAHGHRSFEPIHCMPSRFLPSRCTRFITQYHPYSVHLDH